MKKILLTLLLLLATGCSDIIGSNNVFELNNVNLTVTEISVHKEDGTARYGWQEENGIWAKKYN